MSSSTGSRTFYIIFLCVALEKEVFHICNIIMIESSIVIVNIMVKSHSIVISLV